MYTPEELSNSIARLAAGLGNDESMHTVVEFAQTSGIQNFGSITTIIKLLAALKGVEPQLLAIAFGILIGIQLDVKEIANDSRTVN